MLLDPYFAISELRCGISSRHGGQFVAQKSRMTAFPFRSETFCTFSSSVVHDISAIGFEGGIGKLVVGRLFTEMGRSDTDIGAAAGRQLNNAAREQQASSNVTGHFTSTFYTFVDE